MSQKLWEADSKTKTKSNLFEFEKYLEKKFNYEFLNNFYLTVFKIIIKIERSLLALFNKSRFKFKKFNLN